MSDSCLLLPNHERTAHRQARNYDAQNSRTRTGSTWRAPTRTSPSRGGSSAAAAAESAASLWRTLMMSPTPTPPAGTNGCSMGYSLWGMHSKQWVCVLCINLLGPTYDYMLNIILALYMYYSLFIYRVFI